MFIIIPVKPFDQSKTRLAAVLTEEQRVNLSRKLLLRTLHLACRVAPVVVISRDLAARRLAKQHGAWALVESGSGLNDAIGQAAEWVRARGGQALLVIPGDLPRLALSDLTEMMLVGQHSPAMVIAPCHRNNGTNALLLRPPTLIHPSFGVGSFARHQQAALNAGVEATIYQSFTVAFDIDYPEDLEKLGRVQASLTVSQECDSP